MSRAHEKVFDIVILYRCNSLYSFSASVLCSEIIHRHSLDITKTCHGNNCIFLWNEIFHRNIRIIYSDACHPVISELIGYDGYLFFYHAEKLLRVCQYGSEFFYLLLKFGILIFYLLSFQSGKSTKPHIHYSLSLSVINVQKLYQTLLGFCNCLAGSDTCYHFIDDIQSLQQCL